MREHSKNILHKMTFGFTITGFILYTVAFALPNWSTYTQQSTGTTFNYGLFSTCLSTMGTTTCNSIHISVVSGDWVWRVQVLGCFGMTFYLAATALLFLSFYWDYIIKRNMIYAGSVTGFFAGTCVAATTFLYSNANSGKHDSLDYCFFLAMISIAPIFISAVLSVFNGALVRLRKRKKDREKEKEKEKEKEIEEHVVNEKGGFPPFGTKLEDQNITPGPSSLGDWDPPNLEVDEMLEEILEVEEKENSIEILDKKENEEENEEIKEENEDEKAEGTLDKDTNEEEGENKTNDDDETNVSTSRKNSNSLEPESEEEENEPKIRAVVSFNTTVDIEDRAKTSIPRKEVVDERVTKSASLVKQRALQKSTQQYAILRWHCKKCPFEHTMSKPADELTPAEFLQVVKYVEGVENVMNYKNENLCMPFVNNKRLPPVRREPPTGRRYVKKSAKKEESKSPEKSEVNEQEDVNEDRPSSVMSHPKPTSSPEQTKITPIEECPGQGSTEKIIRSASRISVGTHEESADTTNIEETDSKTNLEEGREIQTFLVRQYSDNERKSLHSGKRSIKSVRLLPLIGNGTVIHTDDHNEDEDIHEDTFTGPGLSDDEDDTSNKKEPELDQITNRTNTTSILTSKMSQRTYSSQKVTPLLRPAVLFKNIFDIEDSKDDRRARTSVPRPNFSLVGASNKSASLTKQRRALKEHKVAVVRDKCKKCPMEVSFAKYADDLTTDEKTRIETIVNRSELPQI